MPHRGSVSKEQMGAWVERLSAWDVFCTWTFARLVTANGCVYWANRMLDKFQSRVAFPIRAFWAVECGPVGGMLHIHSVVSGVAGLQCYCGERKQPGKWGDDCCLLHMWPCGYARVFEYDSRLGASFYVAKYVTKDFSEWGLYGHFPQAGVQTASNFHLG